MDRTVCNDDSAGIACVLPVHHSGPHAYPLADALRHAADGLPQLAADSAVTADANERRLVEWCADRLRRMADEASQ